MKFFKSAMLTAIFLAGGIGCDLTDDCGSSSPSFYEVNGLTVQNRQLNDQGYRNAETLPNNAEVTFDQYALSVYPTTKMLSMENKFGSGGSVAFACSPVPPKPSENVVDMAVFSNADFQQATSDKVLMAGDTLNSLFQIADFYSGEITGLTSFLKRQEPIAASDEGFFLILLSQPKVAETHQFTVHYRLDNGEFYTFTAPPVTVLP